MQNNSKSIPKIYCIGSNLESFECLRYLIERDCAIHTLITLPSGKSDNVSDYYDLHEYCDAHGIATLDTTNVNDEKTIGLLKDQKPDYLFTFGWSQIFKEEFISCFSQFIIGTHPSKLPYGRGRAPLPWTVLEGLEESAVSFFKIDQGVDTGSIITQRPFKIPQRAYVEEVYGLVSRELAKGFYELYQKISSGEEIKSSPQKEEGATNRGKRSPEDGLISFNSPVEEVDRLIRAVSHPYPGAYCYYKYRKIIFWAVDLDTQGNYSGTLGQILKRGDGGILVRFSDGNLWLKNPEFEDENPVPLSFFKLGDKLGYSLQDEIHKLLSRQ